MTASNLPVSPSGKSTTSSVVNMIVDAAGNTWTLYQSSNQGLQVVLNNMILTATATAAQLLYLNGNIYLQKKGGAWLEYVGGNWIACSNPTGTTGVQAISSDAFVDSIGVVSQFGTGWPEAGVWSQIEPLLVGSGIRYIRTGVPLSDTGMLSRMQTLAAASIKFNMLTDPTLGTMAAHMASLQQLPVGCIVSVEGINEPDTIYASQQDPTNWVADTISWQQQLYNAIAGSSLKGTPVLSPAMTQQGNVPQLASLVPYCTAMNLHPYPGDRMPECPGWGTDGYGSMAWSLACMMPSLAPKLPVYATELGYSTFAGDIPAGVVASYLPRLLLNRFLAGGLKRSFLYEFYDQSNNTTDPQSNYGLVSNSASPAGIAPKPAYTAIKNLISLMSDPGPAFTPGKLNFTLGGNTANVQQALFARRDGSFILALWQDVEIWNPNSKAAEPATAQSVTVQVSGVSKVGTAVPVSAGNWTAGTLSGGAVTLPVGADLMLLHFA